MSRSSNNSLSNDCTLVIMAKAPREGSVKTRLARDLPPSAVVDLYRCLLADTIALGKSLDGVQVVIMCPATDVSDLSLVAGPAVRVVAQTGDGLAAGLTSAFAQFATSDYRRIIAFNSDSPHLPRTVLQNAYEALVSCDLIVGPTDDGGYYLVGAKACYPELFVSTGMGTTNALGELLTRARSLELSIQFTDTFYDIDVSSDLSRLAAELEIAGGRAPRTAAWLKQWQLARGAVV